MILVIAEQREGTLNRASWEAIAAAQAAGGPVKVAVAGSATDPVAAELGAAEVSEIIAVDSPALAHYTADGYVMALASLIQQEQPQRVFFAHTYQTRDFAPALAARIGRSLITDVTALKAQGDSAVYVRPRERLRSGS
jgi:electron transfer flavoprotein alpha subunit